MIDSMTGVVIRCCAVIAASPPARMPGQYTVSPQKGTIPLCGLTENKYINARVTGGENVCVCVCV